MQFEYECALTGVVERGTQPDDSDNLGDLPVGWTKISITRRQYNPRWVLIQQVKNAMIEGLTQQFPPELQEVQRYAVSIQVEAQFHSLEKDTPMYLPDVEDVVYISDSVEILDTVNEIRDTLGLPGITELADLPEYDEEEEEEEEEGEDDADESHLPHDGEVGDEEDE